MIRSDRVQDSIEGAKQKVVSEMKLYTENWFCHRAFRVCEWAVCHAMSIQSILHVQFIEMKEKNLVPRVSGPRARKQYNN